MPSFKHLSIRRRSKASIHPSDNASSNNSSENGSLEQQQSKSSSTLNSFLDKQSPPTTLSSSRSNTNLSNMNGTSSKTPPPIPGRDTRPRMPSNQSNRYSINGMSLQNGDRPAPATSPLAPRVLSVSDGSWVHQKVLLISGQCAEPTRPIDGHLTVCHHQDTFPPTSWPVCDSHFKALVYLQPGPNRLRLDFTSPKLPIPDSAHSSWININYLPLNSSPPLQLCILVAKDSPETYDAVPERVSKEGNGLATAIKKFRMAAYLWQAFTAEQMNRNTFGRRCYRYEEEWQPGTLTWRDQQAGVMRNEAKIHIVRMDKTVQEIRDIELAQQYEPAKNKDGLFEIATNAVRAYFAPRPNQTQYVSCMFLDAHWDKQVGTVRGHAALGGGSEDIKLAIFGSHCLQSYPAHIEEVVPAFSDCTRTDTNHVANDCNEAGSNWEAANIGIGAHLHETGHLLGCPHQESGIMLRDYTRLNRTFTCREPYSTRTKAAGQRLCLPKDECAWHRLDALRFRFHPTFQLPTDPTPNADKSVQVWTVENGNVLVNATTGIAWIELYVEGDDVCHHWIEYLDQNSSIAGAPRQVTLSEQVIKEQLPPEKRKKKKVSLKIFSCGGGEHEVNDFAQLCSLDSKIKLPDGRPGFKSSKLGFSQMEGSQPQDVVLGMCHKKSKLLLSMRIYHGDCMDGMEFVYEDGSTELFGKRGGKGGGSEFALDFRKGELLLGFYVRAGFWIDGIQILTTTGRRSEIFGKADGGSGYTLIPPRGYSIAGVYGSCGPWLDGFGLIITR
ncbi:zinc metallo ase [Lecanosticta acicola]|uniref:Zinc metallo ase n=1 Tax=Lecanosticta acicola TaxID=111012 RepID=A0AAI8Z1L0_9PEZI|nr:zinc metallo ase [Lecanosticta acicola]